MAAHSEAQHSFAPQGLIVREHEPLNLEMPFEEATDFVTPTERFYVRCHFAIPEVDPKRWRLEITGVVEEPLHLDLEQLRSMPRESLHATLECAGNNRRFLEPPMKGVQWGQGAVGNAQWSGVRLSDVLARVRPHATATEVILEGMDRGVVQKEGAPVSPITFARSVPFAKALHDVLLADEMNGAPLTPEHGYPLRAVVPGWYAMASIKWLQRIVVTDRPFGGYYQTLDYAYWKTEGAEPERRPLAEMQVKAQIALPREGERLPRNATVLVRGTAWGSEGVERVEFSGDGGAHWHEARFSGAVQPGAWRQWEFEWRTPDAAQECVLMARATDARGLTQAIEHDPNRGSYMINMVQAIRVQIGD